MKNAWSRIKKGVCSKPAKVLIYFSLFVIFYILTFLSIKFKNTSILFINGALVLLQIFLYKGKYSVYVLLFYSSSSLFMLPKTFGIGSIFTWDLLIYEIYILILSLKEKRISILFKEKSFLLLIIFVVYSIFISLINFNNINQINAVSCLIYFLIPIAFSLDNKSEKQFDKLIYLFGLSLIIPNSFMAFILYFCKSTYGVVFLELFNPDYLTSYTNSSIFSFRFPGVSGDPNHMSFGMLGTSSILITKIIKERKTKWFEIVLLLLLQPLCILGDSKTYLIGLAIILLIVPFIFAKRKETAIISLSCLLIVGMTILCFLLQSNYFSSTIYRILYTDTRAGFFESITTNRLSIWINYINNLVEHPFKLLFGNGIDAQKLYGWNYHNTIIQLLWEFGIVGSLIFIVFIKNFLSLKSVNRKNKTLIILTVLIFSFSLHIIYDTEFYALLFLTKIFFELQKNKIEFDSCLGKEIKPLKRKEAVFGHEITI